MAEDTAVLDVPETAAPEPAPPEIDIFAEAEVEQGQEQLADDAETTGAPEGETGESQDRGIETNSPDEPWTPERVEGRLEEERTRIREEHARATADEQARLQTEYQAQQYQARRTQAAQARQGGAYNAVRNMAAWVGQQVEAGKELKEINLDPRVVGNIVTQMETAAVFEAAEQWHDEGSLYLERSFKDWQMPPEIRHQRETALRSGDAQKMAVALFESVRVAAREEGAAAERARLTAEQARTAKAQAQTQQLKTAETARNGQGRPTGLTGGTPPSSVSGLQPLEQKLAREGELTDEEWARYERARSDAGLR